MDAEARIYLATTITLAIVVVFLIVVIRAQARDNDNLHAALADAAGERLRCQETHLGELDAVVEATRPTGPPPLDAYVRPVGIYPTNQPYLNRRSTP